MTNKNIQTEIDAAYLYDKLAVNETDVNIAKVFTQMSNIEKGHALAFIHKINPDAKQLPPPSRRAKILNWIGKLFGYEYVLGVLMDTEKSIATAVIATKKNIVFPHLPVIPIMLPYFVHSWKINQRFLAVPWQDLKSGIVQLVVML